MTRSHKLNHPIIVRLFGACHIAWPRLFVYESVPDGLPLHDFLQASESNRALTWELLYDAALELQYLHSRGVVHGCLQGDTIVVGSDKMARLSHVDGTRWRFDTRERREVEWMAPEVVQNESILSMASDMYAFGICV